MKSKMFVVLIFAGATCLLAQEREKGDVVYRTAGPAGEGASVEVYRMPVVGAPYSATTTNERVQILADGNRIVQTNTGTTARDSQGRTRQDAALPTIGNLSAVNAPHLVFIQDPVAQKSYTLNLAEKIVREQPMVLEGTNAAGEKFFTRMGAKEPTAGEGTGGIPAEKLKAMREERITVSSEISQPNVEHLGTQTMEGVLVTGTRTTRTIPAGKIGNEKPISIVTEVWISPELKTVVMSKQSDPRTGEQTFRLTNISTAEPEPSLFSVPTDFTVVEDSKPMINYRPNR